MTDTGGAPAEVPTNADVGARANGKALLGMPYELNITPLI